MPLSPLYGAAALAFVLAVSPVPGAAQGTASPEAAPDAPIADQPIGDGSPADGIEAREAPHFVPIADACIAAPNEEDCGQVRALVTECAADLDYELCDVLFETPEDVFDDPQMMERTQQILATTAGEIAGMQFEEAEGEIGEAIEATRAMSERTLLRGAENLNSHSSPPLAADDKPAP